MSLQFESFEFAHSFENDGTQVTQAGKFESEPLYVVYFWEMLMQGSGDDNRWLEPDQRTVDVFEIDDVDRGFFPELTGYSQIELWQCEYGFVYADLIK